MVQLEDIGPLTGFLRNHKAYLAKLAKTGRPQVLTVNGKAEVVIQSAAAYQKLLDMLDAAETVKVLRDRLDSVGDGTPGVPASEVLADVRKRLGIDDKG